MEHTVIEKQLSIIREFSAFQQLVPLIQKGIYNIDQKMTPICAIAALLHLYQIQYNGVINRHITTSIIQSIYQERMWVLETKICDEKTCEHPDNMYIVDVAFYLERILHQLGHVPSFDHLFTISGEFNTDETTNIDVYTKNPNGLSIQELLNLRRPFCSVHPIPRDIGPIPKQGKYIHIRPGVHYGTSNLITITHEEFQATIKTRQDLHHLIYTSPVYRHNKKRLNLKKNAPYVCELTNGRLIRLKWLQLPQIPLLHAIYHVELHACLIIGVQNNRVLLLNSWGTHNNYGGFETYSFEEVKRGFLFEHCLLGTNEYVY